MKSKIGLLIAGISLISSYTTHAQNDKVNWIEIDKAFEANAKTPRKIFIDVYTDWCGWCKKMDENTFSNPVIATYLATKFHAVKFNAEGTKEIIYKGKVYKSTGRGPRSPHEFAIALLQGRLSYPSIVFMDENNNLITYISGYLTPDQLEPIMAYIESEAYKTQSWENFRANFTGKLNSKVTQP